MAVRDVFVSHASEDRRVAEEIAAQLERHGITCWLAPRDVPAGMHYAEAIIGAIENAQAAVLVLSEHANGSVHVRNEVERVVAKGKPIFPVRIRNVLPSKSLELYVSAAQWVDAWQPPLEARTADLASAIKVLLVPRPSSIEFTDMSNGANLRVVGVGGAGVRAIGTMLVAGVPGVTYLAGNSYAPSLEASVVPNKLQFGKHLLAGASAGGDPERGRCAAEEALTEIAASLDGADLVLLVAGLGGGTGSGAMPVVARVASQHGALTIAVVTTPFPFEGRARMMHAAATIAALCHCAHTVVLIPDHCLVEPALLAQDAFKKADRAMLRAVRSITDLIVIHGLINIDFADLRTLMGRGGLARMGTAEASGDDRAVVAAQQAMLSPLLDGTRLGRGSGILINITAGPSLALHEVNEAATLIEKEAGPHANVIFGAVINEAMENSVSVTLIATGTDQQSHHVRD